MDIVLDSSAIINLINGGCIDKIISCSSHNYYVGDLITDNEILDPVQKLVLESLIEKGQIILLASTISASTVMQLQIKHGLGLGETECMAICTSTGFSICTDDRKARKCSKKEIDEKKVIGSLYLLRDAVLSGILCCDEVLNAYLQMKIKGGFLPSGLTSDYFCK